MPDGQLPRRRRSTIAVGLAFAALVALAGWVLLVPERAGAPRPLGEAVKARVQPDRRPPAPRADRRPRSAPHERRRSTAAPTPPRQEDGPAQSSGAPARPVPAPDLPPAGDDDDRDRDEPDDEGEEEQDDDGDGERD